MSSQRLPEVIDGMTFHGHDVIKTARMGTAVSCSIIAQEFPIHIPAAKTSAPASITGAQRAAFPCSDYGQLITANSSTDGDGTVIGGRFEMR